GAAVDILLRGRVIVEGSGAAGVSLDRPGEPVGADRGDGLVGDRAARGQILGNRHGAAIGIGRRRFGVVEIIVTDGLLRQRLCQAVGVGRQNGLLIARPVAVERGDGLRLAAVEILDGDVGLGAADGAVAVELPLRRLRQAVGAGRHDRLVGDDTRQAVIGNRLYFAAVDGNDIGLGLVDDAVAVRIAGNRDIAPVPAGRGRDAVLNRAVGIVVRTHAGGAAIGIERRDAGLTPVDGAVAVGVDLHGLGQAGCARRCNGPG